MLFSEILNIEIPCIFLYISIATSTSLTEFIFPKWALRTSDDNLTDIPEFVKRIDKNMLYPMEKIFEKMFSDSNQIQKFRMLQVRLKRIFFIFIFTSKIFKYINNVFFIFDYIENSATSAEIDKVLL